jgi:SAM-dependent methyltransferase
LLTKFLKKPVRFDYMNQWLKPPSVVILDIGCGNHSASLTKKYYPTCKYFGLDRSKEYNNDRADFEAMDGFFELNLETPGSLAVIPDDHFDCIFLSHVIEHLANGESVVQALLPKLRRGGVIYIEFPSSRSLHLPKMRGTLNFHDDPTHKKVYDLNELKALLVNNGCCIVRAGVRRSLKRIILFPFYLIGSIVQYGYPSAGVFWDIAGFADYIIAQKK